MHLLLQKKLFAIITADKHFRIWNPESAVPEMRWRKDNSNIRYHAPRKLFKAFTIVLIDLKNEMMAKRSDPFKTNKYDNNIKIT